MRRTLIAIAAAAAATVPLVVPGSASAAVICSNAGSDLLTIQVTDPTTQVSIDRSGDRIRAFDGPVGGTDACDIAVDPTVTNTDDVSVEDQTAAGPLTLLVSLQGGRFEPGQNVAPPSPEGVGPEVEIVFTGGTGVNTLEIEGSDSADDVDLGEGPPPFDVVANLNAGAEASGADCDDVRGESVEHVIVHGRGGTDDVNATACSGIGGAVPLDPDSLLIEGNNQEDSLRGGPGADSVLGGTQDDNPRGGAGDDQVDGGDQDDKVDGGVGGDRIEGGAGTDRVLYDDRGTPLTITVGNGGADDGGGEDQGGSGRDNVGFTVEHVTGGSAGDTIVGSSVRNVLTGGLGDDVFLGGEGNDDLEGEGGNDQLDGEGGDDDVSGGDGEDTGRGGGGGDDLLGGGGSDRLLGGGRADFLRGDAGKDVHKGQSGNDKINARDRKRDRTISCGKGKAKRESAKVDKKDPKAKSC